LCVGGLSLIARIKTYWDERVQNAILSLRYFHDFLLKPRGTDFFFSCATKVLPLFHVGERVQDANWAKLPLSRLSLKPDIKTADRART